jgi:hypothetical protein
MSETTAGTISAGMTVASMGIPAARPVAPIFVAVSGAATSAARRRVRA